MDIGPLPNEFVWLLTMPHRVEKGNGKRALTPAGIDCQKYQTQVAQDQDRPGRTS